MKALIILLALLVIGGISEAQTHTTVQSLTNPGWMTWRANFPYSEVGRGALSISDGQLVFKDVFSRTITYSVPVADTDYLKANIKYSTDDTYMILFCQAHNTQLDSTQSVNNSCRFWMINIYQTVAAVVQPTATPAPVVVLATPTPVPVVIATPTPAPTPVVNRVTVTNSVSAPYHYSFTASNISPKTYGVFVFISGGKAWQIQVSQADTAQVRATGYSGQSASMQFACDSNYTYYTLGGAGWWIKTKCHLTSFSYIQ